MISFVWLFLFPTREKFLSWCWCLLLSTELHMVWLCTHVFSHFRIIDSVDLSDQIGYWKMIKWITFTSGSQKACARPDNFSTISMWLGFGIVFLRGACVGGEKEERKKPDSVYATIWMDMWCCVLANERLDTPFNFMGLQLSVMIVIPKGACLGKWIV